MGWYVVTQRTPDGVETSFAMGDDVEVAWARAPGGPLDDIETIEPITDADLIARLDESMSGTDVDGKYVHELATRMEYERGWCRDEPLTFS